MNNYRLCFQKTNYGRRTTAILVCTDAEGESTYADPIIFRKKNVPLEEDEPFIKFDTREEAQGGDILRAIFNALWDEGVRPDGYDDVKREMKATSRHLEDMRCLVFKKSPPK